MDFREKILFLLGGVPHMNARSAYADLVQTNGSTICLRWEWIKRPDLLPKEDFEVYEGEEWVTIQERQIEVVT